jgi:hypothetical protein
MTVAQRAISTPGRTAISASAFLDKPTEAEPRGADVDANGIACDMLNPGRGGAFATYADCLAFFFLFARECAARGCGTNIARWRSHWLLLSTAAFACANLPALR